MLQVPAVGAGHCSPRKIPGCGFDSLDPLWVSRPAYAFFKCPGTRFSSVALHLDDSRCGESVPAPARRPRRRRSADQVTASGITASAAAPGSARSETLRSACTLRPHPSATVPHPRQHMRRQSVKAVRPSRSLDRRIRDIGNSVETSEVVLSILFPTVVRPEQSHHPISPEIVECAIDRRLEKNLSNVAT